jgi:hypothetical protein
MTRILISVLAICGSLSIAHADIDDLDAPPGMSSPAPVIASGLRIAPEVAVVIPRGDLVDVAGMTGVSYGTSVAPGVWVGYEVSRPDYAVGFGGMARFTQWQLPDQWGDSMQHWTLETHAYGRAALHVGRFAPFAGVSIGLDTNHLENMARQVWTTAFGLGLNLSGGISIACSRTVAVEAILDFHPGTDVIDEGADASVSYLAARFGVSLRL